MKDQSGPVPLVILDVQDAIDRPIWDGKNNPEYLRSSNAFSITGDQTVGRFYT